MSFDALMDRFAHEAPVATMTRALMANILSIPELDAIFGDCRQRQYEDKLLFSSVVGLLSLVVTKAQPSVHAAYQAQRKELGVSVKALYDKLAGVELPVTRELVRRTGERMLRVVEALDARRTSVLKGYRTLILDGSHLAASEHRLAQTRRVKGGPLPGQGLVVLDADARLIIDFLPSEDGHDQERALLGAWVDLLEPGQLWIADRNFCTKLLMFECALNRCHFIVREHAGLKLELQGVERPAGQCATGQVWEQAAVVPGDDGTLAVRRITLYLDAPTAENERRIHLLTNLPSEVSAAEGGDAYHRRWDIERAFGELTLSLNGEIDTLCYPDAALLAYAVALVTYNLLAVVKAAMSVVHGAETVAERMSTYYLASEVTGIWQGLEIAVPASEWRRRYADLPPQRLGTLLVEIARHTHLRRYQKHPRGPKKPRPKRQGTAPHVSTARLLAARQRR
jgi:IS4 transposase